MEEVVGTVVLLLAVIGIVTGLVWSTRRGRRRARALVHEWAAEQGHEILELTIPALDTSPFLTSRRKHVVLRLRSRDADGAERLAWIRCGGSWSGLMNDCFDVEWDEPTS